MAELTLAGVFCRMDCDHDRVLSDADLRTFAKNAGVGDGFFGGMVVSATVDRLKDIFDGNRDGEITEAEFRTGSRQFITVFGLDMEAFAAADTNPADGRVDFDELRPSVLTRLIRAGELFASQGADAGTKLALLAFGDGRFIARANLASVVADIMQPAPAEPACAPIVAAAAGQLAFS